jgi:hypothetical protein
LKHLATFLIVVAAAVGVAGCAPEREAKEVGQHTEEAEGR